MEFESDPAKNEANLAKYGIDFPGAARIFDGSVLRKCSDRVREERWKAIGVLEGREIAVIYTIRGERYRIISARRARKNERRAYREVYPG